MKVLEFAATDSGRLTPLLEQHCNSRDTQETSTCIAVEPGISGDLALVGDTDGLSVSYTPDGDYTEGSDQVAGATFTMASTTKAITASGSTQPSMSLQTGEPLSRRNSIQADVLRVDPFAFRVD